MISTRDEQLAYVRQWRETGRFLEELRGRALRQLSDADAASAADDLLSLATELELPPSRRTWSGLITMQALLHRRARR